MSTPCDLWSGPLPPGLRCRRCTYDLAGLSVDGVCPECGKPIDESLRGDLLRDADVTYVRTLHRGVMMIQFGILGSLIATLSSMAYRFTFSPRIGQIAISDLLHIALLAVHTFGGAAASVVAVIGWFWFTASDPGLSENERGQPLRRFLRVVALTTGAATVVTAVMRVSFGTMATAWHGLMVNNPPSIVATALLDVASMTAWIVQFFAGMAYLRWMAQRIPDEGLRNRAGRSMWVLPLWWTVGRLLCGLGPLIAIVLYLDMFSQIRVHLRAIMRGEPIVPRRP